MSDLDRETLRLDFLKAAGLSDALRAPLPGDASTRRYERLTTPAGSTSSDTITGWAKTEVPP